MSNNIKQYIKIDSKPFNIISNASGCYSRYKEQLDELVENGFNTIISKTCTLLPNNGNSKPNFVELNDHASINCLGMPNSGFKYYCNLLPEYHQRGVTYIISMDASDWNDLRQMLLEYDKFISQQKIQLGLKNNKEFVEINASCPNKLDPVLGTVSRIISYDPISFARLLENIKSLDLQHINIGIKLSPFVDKLLLEQISVIIKHYASIIKYIVCGNSIPNGMIMNLDNNKPHLSVKTGGISGITNRLLGVSNVYQFCNLLAGYDIVIIGCGGIENENDVMEYLAAGAKCVQVGRMLYTNGISKLSTISINLQSKL